MFPGHLAVALGAKRFEPRLPLGAAVAAAFGLDLLWPILVLSGAEVVSVQPGLMAFSNLSFDSYPWSHSLLAAPVWSVLAALLARVANQSWRVSAILGCLVASHWVLDFVTHRPDLPLWPGGPLVGLGLWESIPGTFLIEGGMLFVGVRFYIRATPVHDRVGLWGLIALVGLVALIWITGPWSPPPPSGKAVASAALILWLFPFWAWWIDAHRAPSDLA